VCDAMLSGVRKLNSVILSLERATLVTEVFMAGTSNVNLSGNTAAASEHLSVVLMHFGLARFRRIARIFIRGHRSCKVALFSQKI